METLVIFFHFVPLACNTFSLGWVMGMCVRVCTEVCIFERRLVL